MAPKKENREVAGEEISLTTGREGRQRGALGRDHQELIFDMCLPVPYNPVINQRPP